MGKASRNRSARAEISEMKKEQELKKAKAQKKKNLITIITSVVCVVLCVVFVLTIVFTNRAKTNGTYLRNKTAMSTSQVELSAATFTYFFNYQFMDFVNKNKDNLASMGLDLETPLQDQTVLSGEDQGKTWYEVLLRDTEKNLKEIITFSSKAKAEGIKLTKDDEKNIDEFFKNAEKGAKESKISVEDYLYSMYGQGVNKDDIRKGLELSFLATRYYEEKINSHKYSEEEINDFYEKNKNDFLGVDFKYYTFSPNINNDMSEADKKKEIEKSKANSEKLMKAKNPAEFDKILTDILKADGKKAEEISAALKTTEIKGAKYDDKFNISVWAFSEKAKLHGVNVSKNGNRISVYMITKLPYRNNDTTRTVRHILISTEDKKDDEAKKEAEKILKEFNEGKKTEESFGELAVKHSDDKGSLATKGLYENFAKGTMVKEFEDWSFDAKRKYGDTEIVKTQFGYHIMYFVEKGEPIWKTNAVIALKNEKFDKQYEKFEKEFPIETNVKAISDIPVVKFRAQQPQPQAQAVPAQ